MEVEAAVWGATSAFSSTTRVPMSVDSAAAKGPSTTEGALPIPRDLANDILAAIPLLPNEWPLVKIVLSYRTLTSITCHGGVFSLCMSSYAPLIRIQLFFARAPFGAGPLVAECIEP